MELSLKVSRSVLYSNFMLELPLNCVYLQLFLMTLNVVVFCLINFSCQRIIYIQWILEFDSSNCCLMILTSVFISAIRSVISLFSSRN